MKKTFKSMLGVTLLEIMLVMAIAAMVIVMSIRYYQAASSNQRVASAADMLSGFVGAAENYIQSGGTIGSINSANLAPYLPGNTLGVSPWGTAITLTSTPANGTFTATLGNAPGIDCWKLGKLLATNKNITLPAACTAATAPTGTTAVTAIMAP